MPVHVLLSLAVTAATAWQDAERAMTWVSRRRGIAVGNAKTPGGRDKPGGAKPAQARGSWGGTSPRAALAAWPRRVPEAAGTQGELDPGRPGATMGGHGAMLGSGTTRRGAGRQGRAAAPLAGGRITPG